MKLRDHVLEMVIILAVVFVLTAPRIFPIQNKPMVSTQFLNMVNASVVIYDGSGGGSGVFIADNVILTAGHCLKNVESLNIELSNGTVLKSSDFYLDEKEDVGFIFVDANEIGIAKVSQLPPAIGDTVHLVGAPFNRLFAFTLTKGVVSHLDRDLPDMGWEDLLQVDAEGGPGSSGGPLYNSEGNLIGIYVGHVWGGGIGVSLCESAKSILEAYERAKECRKQLPPWEI